MFQTLRGRPGHYLVLTLVWGCLSLVNLGTPSLWDIDEGNNAEASREMLEADNYVIPTFNFQLRTDKPALLYWMQIAGYSVFGIGEFAARLPSALAALLTILLTYELGRRMFGVGAGFLGALLLSSTALFCASAHFANPDALLVACCTLTLLLFWIDYESGRDRWLVLTGVSAGVAMLAKGPVGIVLPGAIVGLFLLWERNLRRLLRPSLVYGVITFILVAAPWYGWVIADTRGEFFRGFFMKHNVGRFLSPMENHRGPVVYYLVILLVGFAPWSVFFAATGWHAWGFRREYRGDARYRFLLCWVGLYLLFFSVSRTKLPNYVLPLYPPLALLVGHFLDRWRKGEVTPPAWLLHLTLGSLVLTGGLLAGGLLIGGRGEALLRGRHLPGLENWAALGIIPVLGALAGWWYLRRQRREGVLAACAATAVLLMGSVAAWGTTAVDRYKAPRPLGEAFRKNLPDGDVQVGAYDYFQPSLVFYCGREVVQLPNADDVVNLLRYPIPAFVFLPAKQWDQIRPQVDVPWRELARQRDLYRGCDVVLIANR